MKKAMKKAKVVTESNIVTKPAKKVRKSTRTGSFIIKDTDAGKYYVRDEHWYFKWSDNADVAARYDTKSAAIKMVNNIKGITEEQFSYEIIPV